MSSMSSACLISLHVIPCLLSQLAHIIGFIQPRFTRPSGTEFLRKVWASTISLSSVPMGKAMLD